MTLNWAYPNLEEMKEGFREWDILGEERQQRLLDGKKVWYDGHVDGWHILTEIPFGWEMPEEVEL